MQQYNDFWITGSAVPGPPYTNYWTPGGDVCFQRGNRSVVELVRFNLESFDLADQSVAALLGLELARLVIGTGHAEIMAEQRKIE
jgi:hypothetical protein